MKMEKKLIIVALILLSLFMISAVSAASDTEDIVNSDVNNDNTKVTTTTTNDLSDGSVEKTSKGTDIGTSDSLKKTETIKEEKTSTNKNDTQKKTEKDTTESENSNLLSKTSTNTLKSTPDTSNNILKDSAIIEVDDWSKLKNNITNNNEISIKLIKNLTTNGDHINIDNGKVVTINGNGHTIDAQGQGTRGIFNVDSATLILKNLKLINGKSEDVGGAIYANNAKLTLRNTTLQNNQANNGGAIHADNSQVNITTSTLTNNTATYYGGAIFASGSKSQVNITTSTLQNNQANNGGAISAWSKSQVNINNTTFTNNTATYYGGAIYAEDGSVLNVDYCLFQENTADLGIIYARDSNTKVVAEYNAFTDNYNFHYIDRNGASIDLKYDVNCRIDSFTSLYYQIMNNPTSIINLTRDYQYYSRSTGGYGNDSNYITGIPITTTVHINGNGYTISGANTARIFNVTSTGNLILEKITLTNGKGQYIGDHKTVGGAIYITGGNVTITNSNITNNKATGLKYEYYGGAIYINGGTLNITQTNITNNKATVEQGDGSGGAIYITNAQLNIKETTLKDNTASFTGGVIELYDSNGNIMDCTFEDNIAEGGGAIYIWDGQVNITNSRFTNNKVTYVGGAIYIWDGQLNITNSNFTQNSATLNAGAIYSLGISDIHNCIFNKNTVESSDEEDGNGGAIYAVSDSIRVTNSLFLDNSVNNGGSAIYGSSFDDLTVNHNIFLNNTGNNIIYLNNPGTVNLNYNWFGNTADNYTNKPNIVFEDIDNPKFDNWLFLNATADPDLITVLSSSNITFELFLYNSSSKNVTIYDNSQLKPVNLTITYTNGIVDKKIAKLNETIEYTPKNSGTSSVTARISNAEYTINLTVTQIPTNITVNTDPITLNVTDTAKITATLEPSDAGSLTYNSSNETIVTVDNNGNIVAVGQGIANITVSFAGQGNYAAAISKIIQVIVNLKDASVSVNNNTLDLFIGDEFTIVTTTTPDLNVTYLPDDSGIVTVDENGKITALKEGTAQITVKINGKGIYFENSTTVNVTVSKIPTTINLTQNSFTLTVDDNVDASASLTPPEAGNLTYTSNDTNVAKVVNGKIIAVGPGSAKITVSFTGNQKYAATNKTIQVTVNNKPSPTPSPEPTINPTKTVYKVKMYLTLKKVKKISKKTRKLYLKVIVKRNGKKLLTKKITIKVKRNKVKAKKTNKNKAKSKKLTKVQGFKFTVKINGKTYTKKTNKKGKITYTINNLYNKGTYKAKISYKSKYYKKNGKNIKFKIKA